MFRRQDYDFDLPDELIAQMPLDRRSASRLLVLDPPASSIRHETIDDLRDLIHPGDLLVFNNTRVLPARLFGVKQTGGRVEILIERLLSPTSAIAHIRASKAPKPDTWIGIAATAEADVSDCGLRVLGRRGDLFEISVETGDLRQIMRELGHMPLPPYIDREDAAVDRERYQTVFGRVDGAVAAPTAGLHFDRALLDDLAARGVDSAEVTLHVGAGTFQPVRVDDITRHEMHSEWIEVPEKTVAQVRACRDRGGRVIAVGTTAVRSLETAARAGDEEGVLGVFRGDTDIFLYPGQPFYVVDALLTNFHLPESTLLMLVSAFAGYDAIMEAYRAAVAQRYRFFSYGDAMLITRRGLVNDGA